MIKGFWNFFKGLIDDRKVILDLAKNDFKAKYTNSLLGIVWAFMLPLTIILVLWFVFQVGFRSAPVNDIPFILWYIPAFLSWNFFTDAFGSGSENYFIQFCTSVLCWIYICDICNLREISYYL